VLRKQSGVVYHRNDSKMTEKDEIYSPVIANMSINEGKKSSVFPYQSTVFYDVEK
jgi:hypothetical protein